MKLARFIQSYWGDHQLADHPKPAAGLKVQTGLKAGYSWEDYLADQKACYQQGDQTACARSYYSDFT